ncbi:MAG: cobalamin-dependent protein [Desulfobacterales bacterium]
MNELTKLGQAILDLNEDETLTLVEKKLADGDDPMAVIQECNQGMEAIGKGFEKEIFFLAELVKSGAIFKNAMKLIEPHLGDQVENTSKGTVVIGTVKDDIHDIGKNIVVTLLKGTGYKVIDLGVDVAADKFVTAVKDSSAKVVGLSALLNMTYPRMKEVVEAFEEAGMRENVTIIIGGAPCNEEVRQSVGADHFATDAGKGVRICNEVYGG